MTKLKDRIKKSDNLVIGLSMIIGAILIDVLGASLDQSVITALVEFIFNEL